MSSIISRCLSGCCLQPCRRTAILLATGRESGSEIPVETMRTIFLRIAVVVSTFSAVAAQASLDFASLPGSSLDFFGSSSQFQISPSTGSSPYQWDITSLGAASGLLGEFTGGPWTYGPVTTVIPGVYETANVTGPLGNFVIEDGTGHFATGQVNWVEVDTLLSSGALNAAALVNITGMQYDGVNPALLNLAAGGDGSVDISFQFNPGMDLLSLTSGSGPYDTSYSGSFVPSAFAPEPGTFAAGFAALGCGIFGLNRKLRLARA
jgi:hypothetical protein